MKRLFALLALCLSLALSFPAAARDWLRADTPHFIIYSDGYPHELQRWAKKVEMYDALLRRQFDRSADPNGTRLIIYMLEDGKAVARLAGRKYLTGLYIPATEGSFAVTNRKLGYYRKDLSGQATLFHEYAHHFMYRHLPAAYPEWYREGFAEYAASAQFDVDGTWEFGLPAAYRQKHLDKQPLPIDAILFGSSTDMEPKRRVIYYSWSWLLTHMLYSRADRAGQLDRYLEVFGTTGDPRQAARVFGNLDRLEAELNAYAQMVRGYRASKVPIHFDGDISVTELGAVQSRIVELGLKRKIGQDMEATRNELRKVAIAYPGNVEAQIELALIEMHMARQDSPHDYGPAEAALDRTLAADPDHPRANALKADLKIRRMVDQRKDTREAWIAARKRLLKAMQAAPDDPWPFLMFYQSYVRQRSRVPPIAHKAIQRAFALQPENVEIRTAYTVSLASRGRFDDAEAIARVLVSDPHAGGIGDRALALVEKMRAAAMKAKQERQPALEPLD